MYAALAEPTRRNILELLANSGQMSASEISNKFHTSPPAISQHLKILREAKLIVMEKRAQKRIYTLNPLSIKEMEAWIHKLGKLWDERFSALDKLLVVEKKKWKGGEKK